MRYLLTILFGLIITSGQCCDCYSKLWKPFTKENYKDSDIIFNGEVGNEIQQGQFELKIIEVFKGETKSIRTIINPKDNYCFRKVQTGEKWLIYTNSDNTVIYIDECSRSRDIEKTKYWVPPPPPGLKTKQGQKKYKIAYDNYLNSNRGDIEDELKQLRDIKANNR
ncbi:MAG: hypothetical protein ACKO96_48975 [Flammeovirgaceae bacterium]